MGSVLREHIKLNQVYEVHQLSKSLRGPLMRIYLICLAIFFICSLFLKLLRKDFNAYGVNLPTIKTFSES